ncbi:PREDICTED: spindle pole body protein pcp1-like isoform X1 [Lupinus angustifolius]|uniref:spindle pole body protein pcp1-like isoform X1 n=1 Tax=Lupinus angustifolius TaxID=3871 RepID=UPI00092FB2CB|nr:PREDICTED: spindle pole body protein pcp1-like isoform X1 [Lupinus angustifolius]
MASAQVLPNLRKQEHLEAGRRRLEEFRKKKAAERAKKASSASNIPYSDASLNQKQPSEIENVRVNESDGVTTSDGITGAVVHTVPSGMGNDKSLDMVSQSSNQGSLADRTNFDRNDLNTLSTSLVEAHSDIDETKRYNASVATAYADVNKKNEANNANDIYGIHTGGSGGIHYGMTNNQRLHLHLQESQEYGSNTTQSSLHGINEYQSNKTNSSLKDRAVSDHSSSPYFPSKISPQNSVDTSLQIKPTNSSSSDSYAHGSHSGGFSDSFRSKFRETITSSDSNLSNLHGASIPMFNSKVYEASNSNDHTPVNSISTESNSKRSRPSFLDSLNVTRPSSGSPFQQPKQDSSMPNHSEPSNKDISGYFHKPSEETKTVVPFSNFTTASSHSTFESASPSVYNNNSQDRLMASANENGMDKKHDYYAPSKNEDFTALEQHIEDLTQEKFSLQRALDASRVLAESLAAENSSLTDNYNQQRSVVNQLKSDMEKLQEDIKAQLVELESVRNLYTNAQLECNAADERAKLLASEVIGLEEKALKLRSSELKLEKQLENAQAEISSYRKKMSSLDKDRQDMKSTIGSLQEEKKVLQSKLRKASGIGKSIESQINKRDASTSTEDIASQNTAENSSNQEINDSAAVHDAEVSSLSSVPEFGHSSFGVSPVNIPNDQMRTIENINALISELALEKEDLTKALTSESSECSRVKAINKELSRKLEIQTQRLELLTAQSMVSEHIPANQPDSHIIYENNPYADEGDEVVERVLGWIMKLFPGGPSKRRTSKLL